MSPPTTSTAHHHHARDAQDWWVPIFRGGWLCIVGSFAIFWMGLTQFALTLLFATGALVAGGVLVTNGLTLKNRLNLAQGALSLVVGLLALVLPPASWQSLVFMVGAWAFLMGAADLLLVSRHHAMRGRNLLAGSALVSVLGGLLAFFVPRFPNVLTIQAFGILAVLAGAALIGFGLRRRRRKGHTSAETSAHRDEERRVEELGSAAHT